MEEKKKTYFSFNFYIVNCGEVRREFINTLLINTDICTLNAFEYLLELSTDVSLSF